ncbi:MAG: right-handed parallel beta-helix repeat-containing protein [Dehalococcoidia bacterium]
MAFVRITKARLSLRRLILLTAGTAILAIAAASLLLSGGRDAGAGALVVNTTDDDVIGACDLTHCSFREALLALQSPGETITFDIGGAGAHVIQVGSSDGTKLPAIAPDSVTIDGYTQAGASANTAGSFQAGNASLQIVLDGSQVTEPNAQGLWIGGEGVTVRGLVIQNFSGDAIHVGTAASAVVKGNYIGTDPAGTSAEPNAGAGVHLVSNMPGNLIGGNLPADRNLISGNMNDGVQMDGVARLAVYGNFIGTDVTGTAAIANQQGGVAIHSGPESDIGAPEAGGGNLISGNAGDGITISGASNTKIDVRSNRIGTTANGQSPLGNTGNGIYLSQGAFGNTLGAVAQPNWNIIAFNAGAGISLGASAGIDNYIDPNVIHSNGGLGIDLRDDGFTSNDLNDPDTGPNDVQNFAVITRAEVVNDELEIEGTLNSVAGKFYPIFFFASSQCDPSGYGEGERFLGEAFAGGPGPDYTFADSLTAPVFDGEVITSVVSNPESSSEFSECVTIVDAPPGTPTPSPSPSPSPTPTPTATPVVTPGPTDSGSPTVTATPTGEPTPTNTPTPTGTEIEWANTDCSGGIDPVDSLKTLRADAGLQVVQPAGCPDIGEQVLVAGIAREWGDVDCSDSLNPIDALKILRHDAGLPVTQPNGCPEMGELVMVT